MFTIKAGLTNQFNIFVLVFILIFIYRGAKKGFLLQIVSTLSTLVSLFVAWRYSSVFARFLSLWPKNWNPLQGTLLESTIYDRLNQIGWFLILFLVCNILFHLLEKLASGLQNIPVLKQVSGLLGAVLGGVNAVIWIVILGIVMRMPIITNGTEVVESTYIGTISDATFTLLGELGAPISAAEAVDQIVAEAKNLDDADQKTVEQWLKDQGFTETKEAQ